MNAEMPRPVEQAIALSAVFQAAGIVSDLASTGQCDLHSYNTMIDSLFVFDTASAIGVYGNDPINLHKGLETLSQLSDKQFGPQSGEITRYALSLLQLQAQLNKQADMLKVIHSRLSHMQYKTEHFGDNLDDLSSSLSGLYQDTLSTLKFRIHVTGNMDHLTDTATSDKIRSILFAGVRASMLWRQLGGSKWQLIFGRGKIERQCADILKHIQTLN